MRPGPEFSLDRFPDNDGDYEPGNVRWATSKEQGRNKDNNRRFSFRGESLTVKEWSERTGFSSVTIYDRIQTKGWSIERALTEPVQQERILEHDGLALNLGQWARKLGITRATLRWRLKHWPFARALGGSS